MLAVNVVIAVYCYLAFQEDPGPGPEKHEDQIDMARVALAKKRREEKKNE